MACLHGIHRLVRLPVPTPKYYCSYREISTSIEQVAKLVTLQSHNSQDALVAQAKSFIETTVTTYANNGFIMQFFKVGFLTNVLFPFSRTTAASRSKCLPCSQGNYRRERKGGTGSR